LLKYVDPFPAVSIFIYHILKA